MTHKIIYHLSAENKQAVGSHLISIKFEGGFDDWIYENLKNVVILYNQQSQKNELTSKDLERVRIPSTNSKDKGVKNIYVCGNQLHDNLYKACRIENYFRKKNKNTLISFQQFIDSAIRRAVNAVVLEYLRTSLDAEKNTLKKSNKKPK